MRSKHPAGSKFILTEENPFSDWRISQRYENQKRFDKAKTEAHRQGASNVRELLNQALREGYCDDI